MTMEDIRFEGRAGRLGAIMTAVVVDGQNGKEYRLPAAHEIQMAEEADKGIPDVFAQIPFGLPEEPTPKSGGGASRAFSVDGYGFDQWKKLFTPRQLLALGTFVKWSRSAKAVMDAQGYSAHWIEALQAYLGCVVSRTADYMTQFCVWENGAEEVKHLFMRWALPITWDFAEANPLAPVDRFFVGGMKSAWRVLLNLHSGSWPKTTTPNVVNRSAIISSEDTYDLVFTDPPYYDAIPYSDLMDFFYGWLRRNVSDISPAHAVAFKDPLSPKWNAESCDGELIDDSSRHAGDGNTSKQVYEDGMVRAFSSAADQLTSNGRMIVVFANKKPDAWETLAAAVIRSGFCVNGSWPVVTEMPGGLRNLGRASLASSVWLVCKKRPPLARPGWDNKVMEEMRANIATRLREFWDAGIRGPDFVWAATGPALEAYSKHPVVKKANDPGKTMEVGEFLSHVRRMVVDFVVGQVLTGDGIGTDLASADQMDAPTAYYLLHRHDFGLEEAPTGACILYATACGLSDRELEATWDILVKTGGAGVPAGDEETYLDEEDTGTEASATEDEEASSGSKVKLKPWVQRKHKSMGYEAPGGQPVPLIDRIHRLMHLWRAGDALKVDEYLDEHGLRRQELFRRLLQSLIELSPAGSDERSLLESLSNHVQAKGAKPEDRQAILALGEES
jgi:adenine-specific DNA methylase